MSIYGGGMLNISYVICSLVFSAGEGQSENDLNKVVESERERKLKKKSAEEAKEKIRRNNPNEKLFYTV